MAFTYIASPYTSPDPTIMEERFLAAELYCANALRNHHWVYSPIVHCHEMARRHKLPTDFQFWENYNKAMMDAAKAFTVLAIPGWLNSKGVQMEMDYARNTLRLPIHMVDADHSWLTEFQTTT